MGRVGIVNFDFSKYIIHFRNIEFLNLIFHLGIFWRRQDELAKANSYFPSTPAPYSLQILLKYFYIIKRKPKTIPTLNYEQIVNKKIFSFFFNFLLTNQNQSATMMMLKQANNNFLKEVFSIMNATLLNRRTGKTLNKNFASYEELETIIEALNKNFGLDLEIVASEEYDDCFIGRA